MRTGIFGGTFNPVHVGHLRAAEEVREALGLDRVMWLPSARPPHKGTVEANVPVEDRVAMVSLAIGGNPAFELLETEVRRPGPSYTLTTLETLRRDLPREEIFFMMGLDAFAEIHTWHRPRELFRHAHFTVISRPGQRFAALCSSAFVVLPGEAALARLEAGGHAPLRCSCPIPGGLDLFLVSIPGLAVSSTEIRRRIREGKSVRYLLPAPVESFILTKKLYSSGTGRKEP